MSTVGNMKPRRFVKEFQKRAGLLVDGVAGPQTRMALWLIPDMPPDPDADLIDAVTECLSLSHDVSAQSIRDVIATVREHDRRTEP